MGKFRACLWPAGGEGEWEVVGPTEVMGGPLLACLPVVCLHLVHTGPANCSHVTLQ